jgi:rare lipoprotein A
MRKGSSSLGSLGAIFPAAATAGVVLLILPLSPSAVPGSAPATGLAWAAGAAEPRAEDPKDTQKPQPGGAAVPAEGAKPGETPAPAAAMPAAGPAKSAALKPASKPAAAKSAAEAAKVLKVINTRATWYGPGFHGRRTASGERFNRNAMTLASRHLPFGTVVRVINPRNGKSVVGRVNDRGPFRRGYTADLSQGMARRIGLSGSGPVRLEILSHKKKAGKK